MSKINLLNANITIKNKAVNKNYIKPLLIPKILN